MACGHLYRAACPCMIWLSAEPVIAESETRIETVVFYNRISEGTYHPFCNILWSHKSTLLHCGKELHKDMNTRMQGASGTILKAGYHTRLKELKHSQSHKTLSPLVSNLYVIVCNLRLISSQSYQCDLDNFCFWNSSSTNHVLPSVFISRALITNGDCEENPACVLSFDIIEFF